MYGDAIFQCYHPQIFTKFGYKHPISNAPIFGLHLTPYRIGQCRNAPLKTNISTFRQYVITKIIG